MVLAATSAAQPEGNYQLNYISDGTVLNGYPPPHHTVPDLVNALGLAFNPFGPVWVADNGTGVSTLYDGFSVAQPLMLQIPSPTDITGGNPTGIVFNGSSGFSVPKGTTAGPSRFIFATEDGVIAG